MGKTNGTEGVFFEIIAQTFELGSEDSVVKIGIVCYNKAVFGDFDDAFGHFKKPWGIPQHLAINTGKLFYKGLNESFGIDQTDELIGDFLSIVLIYGNFGNSFLIVLSSCGFNV